LEVAVQDADHDAEERTEQPAWTRERSTGTPARRAGAGLPVPAGFGGDARARPGDAERASVVRSHASSPAIDLARATDRSGLAPPDTVPFDGPGYPFRAAAGHPVEVIR
jgi:hypothetical protein